MRDAGDGLRYVGEVHPGHRVEERLRNGIIIESVVAGSVPDLLPPPGWGIEQRRYEVLIGEAGILEQGTGVSGQQAAVLVVLAVISGRLAKQREPDEWVGERAGESGVRGEDEVLARVGGVVKELQQLAAAYRPIGEARSPCPAGRHRSANTLHSRGHFSATPPAP